MWEESGSYLKSRGTRRPTGALDTRRTFVLIARLTTVIYIVLSL